ncbi:MAG: fasciclin domain-containing protein [bacterium]
MIRYKVIIASALFLLISCTVKSIELLDFLKQPQFSQFNAMLSEARDGGTTVWGILVKRFDKYTIFAPTDAAINGFGKIGLLRDPGNDKLFLDFVKSHIIAGSISRSGLRSLSSGIKTLTDNKIYVAEANKTFYVYSISHLPSLERAQVLYSVEVDNGIVHVIDKVLIQPALKARLDKAAKVVKGAYALDSQKQSAGQLILVLKEPMPVDLYLNLSAPRK